MKGARINLAVVLLAVVVLAVVGPAACFSPRGESDDGETCTVTGDCQGGLECVIVDGDQGVCLPSPTARSPRSCDVDDECRLSTGELWPIESECLSGQCRCLSEEVTCNTNDEDINDNNLVLEEETCRCVDRGGRGDPCITAQTCQRGLVCAGGECTPGAGETGMACVGGDCEGGRCGFRPGNDLGVCE